MKDNDTQNIFENYLAGGLVTDTPEQEGVLEEQPPAPAPAGAPNAIGQGTGVIDPAIVALQAALKKNPALVQQILALPEIAAAAKGGGAPAPGAGAPQRLGGQLPAGAAPAPVPAA